MAALFVAPLSKLYRDQRGRLRPRQTTYFASVKRSARRGEAREFARKTAERDLASGALGVREAPVVNFSHGGQFALKPKRTRGRRFDADIYGDIVVACGDDDDNILDIYSLSGRKQTGEYHGPSEGGLSYMAMYVCLCYLSRSL